LSITGWRGRGGKDVVTSLVIKTYEEYRLAGLESSPGLEVNGSMFVSVKVNVPK
jgi:hypothetical protein